MSHAAIPSSRSHGQHGAAALIVTMLLFFAMVLVALFANRNLVFEQRSSANQYRSTVAFEAAEAGLEWALAQVDSNQRIGDDCLPSTDAHATSFRARYLSIATSTGGVAPRTWNASGGATPLQPTCTRSDSGWSCSCPTNGLPALPMPAGASPGAAFVVQFLTSAKPGIVRVSAVGCTSLAGPCREGAATRADATARLEVAIGLLPGLRTAPAATVTALGDFDAGGASIGLHNADPRTGIAVDAGGAIGASSARLTVPAGAPTAGALIANDPALGALDPDRFFALHYCFWRRV